MTLDKTKSMGLKEANMLTKSQYKSSQHVTFTDQGKSTYNLFKLKKNLNVLKRLKKHSVQKNNAKEIFKKLFVSPEMFSKILYPVLETQISDYDGNNIEIINDVLMGFKDYT